ncbi:MAG: hypothetical protein E7168_03810 [Firmicutes bacterium]|nr:hypothetical protein [Bacillota bacterium]
MKQKKYLITPSLLNSWKYAISLENEYGNLEDFIKVLSREPMETNEAIETGFQYEDFMIKNYEPTKNGCYQVKLSKDITTKTGIYVLYGRLDCLKAGKIYDYKYTGSYDVGKFYDNYQTPMYFELAPEADEFEYLICNNYKEGKTLEELNIYHEVYRKQEVNVDLYQEIDNFIKWLGTNKLLNLYQEKWESKY